MAISVCVSVLHSSTSMHLTQKICSGPASSCRVALLNSCSSQYVGRAGRAFLGAVVFVASRQGLRSILVAFLRPWGEQAGPCNYSAGVFSLSSGPTFAVVAFLRPWVEQARPPFCTPACRYSPLSSKLVGRDSIVSSAFLNTWGEQAGPLMVYLLSSDHGAEQVGLGLLLIICFLQSVMRAGFATICMREGLALLSSEQAWPFICKRFVISCFP